MKTLILVGALVLFVPAFFAVMWGAGALADKGRPVIGWLTLIVGFAAIIGALVGIH